MFKNDDKGRNSEGLDVLSEAAMINAYYICHNVQVGSIWLKQDHHHSQSGPIIGVGERIGTDLEIQFALLDCDSPDSPAHCCVLLSQ